MRRQPACGRRRGLNAWPLEMHLAGRIEWAFPMGQAAGTAAALRVAGRFSVAALQQRLRADGADLGRR